MLASDIHPVNEGMRSEVRDMEDVQRLMVADRIHELQLEAAALRAERVRAAQASPRAPGRASRTTGTGARVRIGRWLIGVGEAIAGRSPERVGDGSDPVASPV